MMKIKTNKIILLLLVLVCATACSNHNDETVSQEQEGVDYYRNPIIRESAPDPTVIRAVDGTFYLYGTEDTRNMPIYKSSDLMNWEFVGTCFTETTRPKYPESIGTVDNPSLWAPEIRYIKGKYVLFYSLATWGQEWRSTVGYALSDSPEGPFLPKGYLFTSAEVNVQNSIDQYIYEEDGKYYCLWGSFSGLYIVELDVADDLTITWKPETKQQIAGNAYEGVNLWKRDGYYYLFASRGSCCEGIRSTYQTVVGRSESLFGPYVNKSGGKMLDNQNEVVLSGTADDVYYSFKGTGHNSILQVDDAGQTWMIYHAYYRPRADGDDGRSVSMDLVQWGEDGWPFINDGMPSRRFKAPVIKK